MVKSLSRLTFIYQLTGIQYFCISTDAFVATKRHSLTRKLKLLFVVNIAIVISEFCAIVFAVHLEKSQHQQRSTVLAGQIVQFSSYSLMIFALLITMLNSLLQRGKAKQIFKNFRNISEILVSLNQSVDYATFENQFKKTLAKLSLSFVASTMAALIFIYQFNQTNIFLWGILSVYPYFFMIAIFSYWTLLIRLIRENLRFIKDCVVQLHKKAKLFRINSETFSHDSRMRRSHETYDFIVKLKRIYGIIYETTSLVNQLIAVPICLFIVLMVTANVSSGYKVFLTFRRDIPVERVAGKNYFITGTNAIGTYSQVFQFQYTQFSSASSYCTH